MCLAPNESFKFDPGFLEIFNLLDRLIKIEAGKGEVSRPIGSVRFNNATILFFNEQKNIIINKCKKMFRFVAPTKEMRQVF